MRIAGTLGFDNSGHSTFGLTPTDLSALDADFSKLTVYGGRTNKMQMRVVEREG